LDRHAVTTTQPTQVPPYSFNINCQQEPADQAAELEMAAA
jgi:hypothetical protein